MGHLEKMQDLREVIAMLLNINMELCKKVEFLLDDIDAKQEEIGLWQETVKERDDEIIKMLEKSKNGQQTEDSLFGMSQEKLKENVQSESPSLNESEEQWESGKADLVGSDDILDKELIENQKNESNTSSNGQMMFN